MGERYSANSKNIKLSKISETKYIVIRFSGSNTEANLHSHLTKLLEYIAADQIEKIGEPIYAFYNPTWILPFLRRNEIMIQIKH